MLARAALTLRLLSFAQGWAEDATAAYSAAIRVCPRRDDSSIVRAAAPDASAARGGASASSATAKQQAAVAAASSTAQLAMLFALRATGHTRGLRWGAVINDVHTAAALGLGHPGLQKEAQVLLAKSLSMLQCPNEVGGLVALLPR